MFVFSWFCCRDSWKSFDGVSQVAAMNGYIKVTEYVLSSPLLEGRHDGTKAFPHTPPVVLSPMQSNKKSNINNSNSPVHNNNMNSNHGQKPGTGSPISSSGEKVKTGIQFYTSNWGSSSGSTGTTAGDKSPTLTAAGGARILNWIDVMNQSKSEEQQRLDQVT